MPVATLRRRIRPLRQKMLYAADLAPLRELPDADRLR